MEPYQYVLVGCGGSAGQQADAVEKVKDQLQISAIVDTSESALNTLGDRAGISKERRYTSIDQIPAGVVNGVDFALAATPPGTHLEVVTELADAGFRYIVTEKPPEVSLGRTMEEYSVCERHGAVLDVIFQNRFKPHPLLIKQHIGQGLFGDLLELDILTEWYRPQEGYYAVNGVTGWKGTYEVDGGGALPNQGVHGLDMGLWFVGSPLNFVFAKGITSIMHDIEAEDLIHVIMEFQSGVLGHIKASTMEFPGFDSQIRLVGSRRTATLVDYVLPENGYVEQHPSGDPEQAIYLKVPGMGVSGDSGASDPAKAGGHELQLVEIGKASRNGTGPTVPKYEAMGVVNCLAAVNLSSLSGIPLQGDIASAVKGFEAYEHRDALTAQLRKSQQHLRT